MQVYRIDPVQVLQLAAVSGKPSQQRFLFGGEFEPTAHQPDVPGNPPLKVPADEPVVLVETLLPDPNGSA